ncbi:MAG: hypothetical protein J1F17_07130, partial [Oscillospiraceae bacterium]|nr:hypothetical protein [Oscillospiraceae bacterium]
TVLAMIIMLSSVAIMPSAVSAAAKTKKVNKTFYPVSHTLCGNSYGYVTLNNNSLMLVQKTKGYIKNKVSYIEIKGQDSDAEYLTFFMRGKTVIYNDGACTYSINLDGTNRKNLTKQKKFSTSYLLGGYGSDIIVYGYGFPKTNIYKVNSSGKMTSLINASKKNGEFNMFGSKIYCTPDHKGKTEVYDLKTNKTKTISRINSPTYGKKNMYYINKNNNLIRVDLNNKKKTVAKNVHNILDVNNGSTVVYSKLDKSNNEVYYRQTGDKKVKKIGTFKKLVQRAVEAFNYEEKNYYYHCGAEAKESSVSKAGIKAKIAGKIVAFSVIVDRYHTPIILSVSINGGEFYVEKSTECYGYYDDEPCYYEYCNFEYIGNTLAFRSYEWVNDGLLEVKFREIEQDW